MIAHCFAHTTRSASAIFGKLGSFQKRSEAPRRLQLHQCSRRLPQRWVSQRSCVPTAKMYVPSDSFGGVSPERRAARALRNLFTFIAVRIVTAQLEGSGRGALASYNPKSYEDLTKFIEENPLTDGDEWLKLLLRQNEMLAVRIMEVRKAYCEEDFEWDQARRLALKATADANAQLMQQHAEEAWGNRFGG